MADCVEFVDRDKDTGEEFPIDATAENPNGIEFDNLYLDMNGIIHPCTHPEDKPPPTTEEAMFHAVFEYVDRIFSIIRPRKLIYMAIDGVAPRAKINQQRSRRFRSAQEMAEKKRQAEELRKEWSKVGTRMTDDDKEDMEDDPFDSNVITPGTPFMARLATALRNFVAERVQSSLAWQNLVVVFSDASVPGEGEHKIAEFIRRERTQAGYNPNLKHVMYGLDADLIMLALATHEVNFTILREEVIFPKRGPPRHGRKDLDPNHPKEPRQIDVVMAAKAKEAGLKTRAGLGGSKPFHFLHIHILREYLDYEFKKDIENELAMATTPVPDSICYDLERVLDDFVFMCFFVGNDFLPHLPMLEIREGAIDFLIEVYKSTVSQTGYLTSKQGEVNFDRVRKMLKKTVHLENEVFQQRAANEKSSAARAARDKQEKQQEAEKRKAESIYGKNSTISPPTGSPSKRRAAEKCRSKTQGYQDAAYTMKTVALGRRAVHKIGSGKANAEAAAALKKTLSQLSVETGSSKGVAAVTKEKKVENTVKDEEMNISKVSLPTAKKTKEEFNEALKERMRKVNELEVVDTVKLGEDGWKGRYYKQKFGWDLTDKFEKTVLIQKYLEGLQWVMKYYYVGCMSWGWYYPYHYAPFASDLVQSEIDSKDICFQIGRPFEPLMQLQAVMPASSGTIVLPKCYSDLMKDADSPIIDYYPEKFELDLNGKRFAWQGVALLPFIDEVRLREALEPLKELLTDEERERNSFGECCAMVHRNSRLGRRRAKRTAVEGEKLWDIAEEEADGQMFGQGSFALGRYGGHERAVISIRFELPRYKAHSSQILSNATLPVRALHDGHLAESKHSGWKVCKFGPLGKAAKTIVMDRQRRMGVHERYGGRGRYRGGGGGRYGV